MIESFKDKDAQLINDGISVAKYKSIENVARRKLRQLEIAASLNDLRIPPGNQLEKLQGNRAGQHSIRVNDQYRVCFVWQDGKAKNVEIVDYH